MKKLAPKLAFVILLLGTAAAAASDRGLIPRIVNGLPSTDFPTTAAVLEGSSPENASMFCSATLIGCETVLTAAHCVCGTIGQACQSLDPSNTFVYLQHAGVFSVDQILVHPSFDFPNGDVALLKLSAPVEGITPTPINDIQAIAQGTPGVIAGFGQTGDISNEGFGIKRFGQVQTARCTVGISNQRSICWRYENPVGPPGTDSNTCNGDSGGPLFVDLGAGQVVAGVTSGGNSPTCNPTDRSYDANVFFYSSWILDNGGPDVSSPSCGPLPAVGESGTSVTGLTGLLDRIQRMDTHTVQSSDQAGLLRVTMNANDDGFANFNMYLKHGSAPTGGNFDCAVTGTGQFGVCEVADPAPGTWFVRVLQSRGSGEYQVTATTFEQSAGQVIGVEVDPALVTVAPGDLFTHTLSTSNPSADTVSFFLLRQVTNSNGREFQSGPFAQTLAPNGSRERELNLRVPNKAGPGELTVVYIAQDAAGNELGRDDISVMVVP